MNWGHEGARGWSINEQIKAYLGITIFLSLTASSKLEVCKAQSYFRPLLSARFRAVDEKSSAAEFPNSGTIKEDTLNQASLSRDSLINSYLHLIESRSLCSGELALLM
jgi:hypothetical protein